MARRYDCNDATDRKTGLREAASAVRRGARVHSRWGVGNAFTLRPNLKALTRSGLAFRVKLL